ncbi:hypothetical protein K1719_011884 [Acacia pycnantha]|nr:hypothetical protein K1719_011884 [Acacia pycnantha]
MPNPDEFMNELEPENQPEPESPNGSTHSSVGDNFDYPEIQDLENEEAFFDDYHYILNDNVTIIQLLESYYEVLWTKPKLCKEQYLMFLSLAKNYQAGYGQYSAGDWIRSTLYYFPRTKRWARIINNLLDEGPIVDIRVYFRYLKCLTKPTRPGSPKTIEQRERTTESWVNQFCKLKPPGFRGKNELAEDWLLSLEKIFEVIECPDNRKAQLAIYKLEGDAHRWKSVSTTPHNPVTWEMFPQQFNEQYFPPSIQ